MSGPPEIQQHKPTSDESVRPRGGDLGPGGGKKKTKKLTRSGPGRFCFWTDFPGPGSFWTGPRCVPGGRLSVTYLLGLNFNFGESNRGLFFQLPGGFLDFLFFLVNSTSDSSTLKDFPRGGLRWRIYGKRFSGRDLANRKHVAWLGVPGGWVRGW